MIMALRLALVPLVFLLFIAPAGCSREPHKTAAAPARTHETILAKTTLLATIGPDEKPVDEGTPSGQGMMLQIVFSEQGGGVAYIQKKDGLFRVEHNGRAGKSYELIEGLALSPDGKRSAFVARINDKWCIVVDAREGRMYDSVGFPRFSPDSRHVVYNATSGDQARLVVDEKESDPFPSSWDETFTGDSARVISIRNFADDDTLHQVVISDPAFKNQSVKKLRAVLFVYNKDLNRIAAIAEDKGKKRVIVFSSDRPDDVSKGPLYDEIAYHAFGSDGVSIAYVALRGGKRYAVLNDKEELLPNNYRLGPPAIRPDGKAAGILLADDDGYFFYQAFAGDSVKRKKYQEAWQPLYNSDGSRHAYIARQGKRVFMVVNDKEGPAFDTVVTPMFSPDGRFLVYRARKDGRRFVVVADANGTVLRRHAGYEQVNQQVFTNGGTSIAYGVKDGRKLIWQVDQLP